MADFFSDFKNAIESNPQANPTVGYSTPVLGGAGSFNASVSSSGPVSKFPSSSDLFAAARLNIKF